MATRESTLLSELPQADKRDLAARLRKVAERLEKEADNPGVTAFADGGASGGMPVTSATTIEDWRDRKGAQWLTDVREPMVYEISVRIESEVRPSPQGPSATASPTDR